MMNRITFWLLLCSIALMFALSHTLICAADDLDRPPPLTFDKHVDYVGWYNEYVSNGKSDNAFADYTKLCPNGDPSASPSVLEESLSKDLKNAQSRIWDPEEFTDVIQFLNQHPAELLAFQGATRHKHFWQPLVPGEMALWQVPSEYAKSCRTIGKALAAKSSLRQDDQISILLSAWETLLRNADHMYEGKYLLLGLVGAGQSSIVDDQIKSCLGHGVLKEDDQSACLRLLAKHSACPPPYKVFVPIEWACHLDAIQTVCTKARLNPDRYKAFLRRIGQKPIEGAEQVFDPEAARDAVDKYFEDMTTIAMRPYSLQNCLAFEKLEKQAETRFADFPLLRSIIPKLTRSYQLMLRIHAERKGTILLLADHVFRNEHGNWPKSLSQLRTNEFNPPRIDPYSDRDFIYKLTKDGPLLYSIASDGKDDGGRHDPKWGESPGGGDYVFWPVQDDSTPTMQPKRGD